MSRMQFLIRENGVEHEVCVVSDDDEEDYVEIALSVEAAILIAQALKETLEDIRS